MSPAKCMYFNLISDAASPVGTINESGSRVNLHPGVMARGDGLHPPGLWQNGLGDLCPNGPDIPGPNDVRGCPVPGRGSVATTSIGPIEVTPWVLPLGRPGHERRRRPLGFRDND